MTSIIALNWGTPIPATNLVVQIDPGPIPTFTISAPLSAKNFAELVQSIKSGEISGRIAKDVFEIMVESGDNPKKIIESKGMKQQSDPKELEKMINEILTNNKDKVNQYKAGKEKLFGFFVGQVMKSSGGKANPQLTNEILKKLLKV